MQFRHEMKHTVNYGDLCILRQRLNSVADVDPHARNGSYTVRSLYFDTPWDTALREKMDGVSKREKFRIRCYNADFSRINLEKKIKQNGLGTKRKARLTVEQTQAIIDGNIEWMATYPDELVQELYCKMVIGRLEPKTIVEYTREPFVYGPGNTRVTLDYDLRTGIRSTDFLNPDVITVPVPDALPVLEVKWDEFLPAPIRHAVQLRGRRTEPYSKYAKCRVFG